MNDIKTWRQRMPAPRTEQQCSMNCFPRNPPCGDCMPITVHGDPIAARDAEIADLRAALAQQAAPAQPTECEHKRQATTAMGAATNTGWKCKDCGALLSATDAPDRTAPAQPSAASADDLMAVLREFIDYHTKPAGMTVDIATDKDALTEFMGGIEAREKAIVTRALALLEGAAPTSDQQAGAVARGDGLPNNIEMLEWKLRQTERALYLRKQHDAGDVWYWQDDGGDNLESMSMSMAVVIRADQLRDLLAAPAAIEQAGAQPVADAVRRLTERMKWMLDADQFRNVEAMLSAIAAPAPAADQDVLEPVEGDLLPPIGSKVMIHLARQDAWVEHTVSGYYVWGALSHQVREGEKNAHRVFVRVRDAEGYDNARLLSEVRRAAAPVTDQAAPQGDA